MKRQGTGKITSLGLLCLTTAVMAFAAPGGWLKSVPTGDKARTNPYSGQTDAIEAGKNLFANNCSKCHGANAEGKGRKPALVSDVLRGATDGEIQWLIKNGEPFKGMPGWGSMPEQERWQIVAWLRSVNEKSAEGTK